MLCLPPIPPSFARLPACPPALYLPPFPYSQPPSPCSPKARRRNPANTLLLTLLLYKGLTRYLPAGASLAAVPAALAQSAPESTAHGPVSAAVDCLDGLHSLTGLPWWASLALTGLGESHTWVLWQSVFLRTSCQKQTKAFDANIKPIHGLQVPVSVTLTHRLRIQDCLPFSLGGVCIYNCTIRTSFNLNQYVAMTPPYGPLLTANVKALNIGCRDSWEIIDLVSARLCHSAQQSLQRLSRSPVESQGCADSRSQQQPLDPFLGACT